MRVKTAMIVAALVLGTVGESQAQGPDSSSLAQLRPSRFVRIETAELGRVKGTVIRRSAGEILLGNGVQHVIPVQSLRRAWVRSRHTMTGAIIGGVLGAGGGVFVGLLAQALCEDGCGRSYVVPGGLVGAALGVGAGAIIGTAFPRWKELR